MGDGRIGMGRDSGTMRIVDLMALVIGMALALSLGEIFSESWISAARVSEPWASALRAAEYVSKLNIALALVVLAQRLRGTGVFRPAEWLILTNAMRSVHWRLAFAGGMDWASSLFGWAGNDGRFRAWYTLGTLGLLAVTMPLLLAGGRLPRWLKLPLLALLPLFVLWGPAIFASHELDTAWEAMWPGVPYGSVGRSLYLRLMQAPAHILVCVSFVASLRDLARGGRAAWSWAEWVGLAAALLTGTAGMIQTVAAGALNFPQTSDRVAWLAVQAGWWVIDLWIAWSLVWALTGCWKRWTGSALTNAADIGHRVN